MVSSTKILKIPYQRTSDRIKDIEVYPATVPPVEVQIHQMVVWRTINGRLEGSGYETEEKMKRPKTIKGYLALALMKRVANIPITDLKGYDELDEKQRVELGAISADIDNNVGELERIIDEENEKGSSN